MDQSVSDAVPEPEEPNVALQDQGREDHANVLKAGIFYADADVAIADRIKKSLNDKGCHTELFDFHVAGKFKMDALDKFIADKQMILWIATQKALDDTDILKAARHIAHHVAIREPHTLTFMSVKPRECLELRLPASLDACTSLIEDENFQKRLDRTISSVRKSIDNKDIGKNFGQSTSTSNAVADDENNTFRQIPPCSDIEAMSQKGNAKNMEFHYHLNVTNIKVDTFVSESNIRNLSIGGPEQAQTTNESKKNEEPDSADDREEETKKYAMKLRDDPDGADDKKEQA